MKTQPYRDTTFIGFTEGDNIFKITPEERIMELEERLIVQKYEYEVKLAKAQATCLIIGLLIGVALLVINYLLG